MLDVAPLLNRSVDIKTLRNNPTQQKPKAHHRAIYVITWHQSQHMVLSLLESGIDQYLTFPISALRLRSKVEEFFKNPKTVR